MGRKRENEYRCSEYNGSLGDNKIEGIWKDGEQSYRLILTKE